MAPASLLPPQGVEQMSQGIVVELVHQCEQLAEFSPGKALACEPAEIVPGQVREQASLVLPVGHLAGNEQLKKLRIHGERQEASAPPRR